nr:replication initiation protein RepM [Moraxella sp. CTOTU47915]
MSSLIVKDNALIQASYSLDLVEQRLILLSIWLARETGTGISHDSLLRVDATVYASHFGTNVETAYTVLKQASKGLFDRYVTYLDKNPDTGKDRSFNCRWVDKIGYEKDSGYVFLRFTQEVVPLITRLEEQFTSYELEQVSKLTSTYAIRLYELLMQWRSKSKTPEFQLEEFRSQLGVEKGQYKTMSNFKKNVLDFSVAQINQFTDINVKYIQHKDGRSITGFSFSFKQKKKKISELKDINGEIEKEVVGKFNANTYKSRDTNTVDMFVPMTDSQRHHFAKKLSKLHELSNLAKGEAGRDYDVFAEQIANELLDPERVKFYEKYLTQVGFKKSI